jgi:hypothetical protein
MKKTFNCRRTYDYNICEGSHGAQSYEKDPNDKIDEELSRECFVLEPQINPSTGSIIKKRYKWFGGAVLCHISTRTSPHAVAHRYVREVEIEMMPTEALLPRGLLSLISKNEFHPSG